MSSSPENEQVLYKRHETIGRISTIGAYYKISVLKQVRKTLMSVGGRPLFDRFEGGCFGQFLRWDPGQKCGMAVHHVLSREITRDDAEDHDMWFEINDAHVRFSNVEFALVTGLRFGPSDFDTTAEYDNSQVTAFNLFCRGGDVTIAGLLEIFNDEKRRLHDPNGESYFRVAHILVLYFFILAYDTNRYVDSWVWALVDDMEDFNSFPWGAYSFLTLKHYVKNISRSNRYHFHGPVWAFHVWSLEVIPTLAEVVAKKESEDARPRCLRWKFRSRIKDDISYIFQKQADSVIPMQPDEEERASLYMQSVLGPDPLGIVFESPRNPVKNRERCRPRVHLLSEESSAEPDPENQEDDSEETQEASGRRKKGKRQRVSKNKRSKPESSTSTGSSGDHSKADLFSKNEMRFMKKTAKLAYKEIKRRLLPKFKKMIVEVFEVMSCSMHSPQVFETRRREIPTPCRSSRQDMANEESDEDLHETYIHVTPTHPTWNATFIPTSRGFSFLDVPTYGESFARHSVYDISHTFIPASDVEIPGRHSVQNFSYGMPPFGNLFDMTSGMHTSSGMEPVYTYSIPIYTHEQDKNDPSRYEKSTSWASDDATDDIAIGNVIRRNPPRTRRPGPTLSSPYVITREPRPVPLHVQHRYQSWMQNEATSQVTTKESAHVLGKSFFRDIERKKTDMDCSSVDLYLMHLRERLINKDHILPTVDEYKTIITDTDVFISLEDCWAHLKDAGAEAIEEWQPPPHILWSIEGRNAGNTMRSWYKAKQIILVCFLNGHFVTIQIHLAKWTAELYDSLYYTQDFSVQEFHVTQLQPVVQLFPKVLAASNFWEKCTSRLTRRDDPLTLKVPVRQYQNLQVGDRDCGPFALMYVERLITGSPSTTWGDSHISEYRRKITQSIFDLYYEETE